MCDAQKERNTFKKHIVVKYNLCSMISGRRCAKNQCLWMPRAVGEVFDRPFTRQGQSCCSSFVPRPCSAAAIDGIRFQWCIWSIFTSFPKSLKESSADNGVFLDQRKEKKDRKERTCTLFSEVIWIANTIHMNPTDSYFFVASWKHFLYISYSSSHRLSGNTGKFDYKTRAALQEDWSIETLNEYWWGTGYSPVR